MIPVDSLRKTIDKPNENKLHSKSTKDKEKFKRIFKEAKNKKEETKKRSEEIPLHDLFASNSLKTQSHIDTFSTALMPSSSLEGGVSPLNSAYSDLHPDIQALFEKLVGEMVLLNSSGVSETMITFSAAHNSSSVLNGMQIVITEYSTAPKSFNVEFYASPAAQGLLSPYVKEFLNTFEENRYTFAIHRLEMYLQEESVLIKKIEEELSQEKKY